MQQHSFLAFFVSSYGLLLLSLVISLPAIYTFLVGHAKLLRDIFWNSCHDVVQEIMKTHNCSAKVSPLEHVLALIIFHTGQKPCICSYIDPRWSFSSQILTVPFVWQLFPYLKEVDLKTSYIFFVINISTYMAVAWSSLKLPFVKFCDSSPIVFACCESVNFAVMSLCML